MSSYAKKSYRRTSFSLKNRSLFSRVMALFVSGKALPYLLLFPALCLELVIHIIPMLVGIFMGFFKMTQAYISDWMSAPFVGWQNYSVVLDVNGPIGFGLLKSFAVTLAFSVLAVGLSWLLGLVGAVILEGKVRGKGFLRTLFIVPYSLPIYAAVIIWSFMLQRDTGALNHILIEQFSILGERPFWLLGDNGFVSLLTVAVWRNWPFAFLVMMAGLQNIPRDLYEAAALDGASYLQQIRRVTLPMLRSVNQVLVLVLFLWTFNDFNMPYVLFGQSPPPSADLVSLHIYNDAFQTWNFGLGSAMSTLLLLFLIILTACYQLFVSYGSRNK